MPIVEGSIAIQGAAEGVFALSQDEALRGQWDPFLVEMRYLDGATQASPGVRARCRARSGLAMVVRYASVRPPASVAIRMERGPRVFRKFAAAWLFRPAAGGATEVTFRYAFTTRWRWLRPVLDPIIRRALRRDILRRLRGLKAGVERAGLVGRLRAEGRPDPFAPASDPDSVGESWRNPVRTGTIEGGIGTLDADRPGVA